MLGLGLDEFSMSGGSIPTIKNLIRKADHAHVKAVVDECLEMFTAKEVNERLDALLKEIYEG